MTSRRIDGPAPLPAENVAQALMRPPWRVLFSRWPWLALGYTALSAVIAALFLLPSIVLFVLLPLWAILCGMIERLRLRMLGFPRQPSGHVRVGRDQRHNWLNVRLTEPATWRELLVLLLDIAVGAVALVTLFFEALALIAVVAVPIAMVSQWEGRARLFGDTWIRMTPADWWKPALIALGLLVIAAYLNMLLAAGQAVAVRWLLAPRDAEIDQRVERLTRSRAAIVAAHEEERRRIERDLHDGVQQELVVLASRLAVLELELGALGSEGEPARAALAATQDQAERAASILRDTVRGIHPAVLTDHGLGAALDELAGRAAVPVRILGEGLERAGAAEEAAAYFLVTEALTNVAKHTDASRVTITARTAGGALVVDVVDDGRGGADPEQGTGLAGLAARAAALEGTLEIVSPPGGPTRLVLTLPATRRVAESPPETADDEEASRHADPVR
ncbi:signal transduction histidine kinase [Microbacterium resistens]|uniref:histidine kinase n=1 Tax=Microbacterium resistens TaxID=156977 RepID=A0ABU1S8S8_9MICO|nr:histidine kinase [Microbacterium resistens]MDR6866021.1 signal transduction histidine kinase [Microbacterium resistens]